MSFKEAVNNVMKKSGKGKKSSKPSKPSGKSGGGKKC